MELFVDISNTLEMIRKIRYSTKFIPRIQPIKKKL